jgi:hypothetical protein
VVLKPLDDISSYLYRRRKKNRRIKMPSVDPFPDQKEQNKKTGHL